MSPPTKGGVDIPGAPTDDARVSTPQGALQGQFGMTRQKRHLGQGRYAQMETRPGAKERVHIQNSTQ